MNQLETRIENLEAKVAFQDETIDVLNGEIKAHQQQLAKMRRQMELLGEKLREVQSNSGGTQELEPPPPHY